VSNIYQKMCLFSG
ncbi:single-strand binding family protein, partial [Chlamydia psittaci 84-8471/1]